MKVFLFMERLKKRNNQQVLNEYAQIQVMEHLLQSTISSLRTVAEQTGMSREAVRKALKIRKFNRHP